MEIIKPSIDQLTKGKYNRYELVIATAKTAHLVVDEYVKQRTDAEKKINEKRTDRPLVSMINKDLCDERAVRNAISAIDCDGVDIYRYGEKPAEESNTEEE